MNIVPVSDVLIVEEIEASNETEGGLILPNSVTQNDTLAKATVLKAGPGQMNRAGQIIAHDFKVGDTIVYQKGRGLLVTYGGKPYVFVNAHQVFGTVDIGQTLMDA